MITKERLEKLKSKDCDIYALCEDGLIKIKSMRLHYLKSKDNYQYIGDTYIKDKNKKIYNLYEFQSNNLFETKEEAEWHKEFGCIERTERLELPTWEEFKKDGEFSFLDKQGFEWDLYSPDDETRISLVGGYDHYEFEYTKEKYTLACRKAKELFLGER